MDINNKNILVAYFSHKGMNYSNGSIIELKKGNTEIAAEIIAKFTNADLFEISTLKQYPFEYNACTTVAKDELRANSRPELANDIVITNYDVIFIGYPNWWGTMPMPVCTFLENHDFSGKTIIPFCTHEGSGMGSSESDIKKLATGVKNKKGLAIHGSSVSGSTSDIEKWLKVSDIL